MRILIADTETTSLDTSTGFIQELAWAIFDMEKKRLLKSRSHLISWNRAYEVDQGAYETTGLSREYVERWGTEAKLVFEEFLTDVHDVDAIGGHNYIDFDDKMLISNIKRAFFSEPAELIAKFKVDTYHDCPYPKSQKIFGLKYLAFDHGHILSNAHQALADVLACAHVFMSYPLKDCLDIANTPLVTLSGHTQYHDQAGREAFYQAKFRWNKPNNRWERRCRAYHIPGTQLQLGGRQLLSDNTLVPSVPGPEIETKSFTESELPF